MQTPEPERRVGAMTNPRSDRVRAVAALARRSARSGSGRFLVEGPQGCRELVRYAAAHVVDLYVTSSAWSRYPDIVEPAVAAGCFVHEVSDEVLAAMADAGPGACWPSQRASRRSTRC